MPHGVFLFFYSAFVRLFRNIIEFYSLERFCHPLPTWIDHCAVQAFSFQMIGIASSAFGVYQILDNERVQMHQMVLVNVQDIKDMATSQAQPVLYFLSLSLIANGFLMAFLGFLYLFSGSKEKFFVISVVSLKYSRILY